MSSLENSKLETFKITKMQKGEERHVTVERLIKAEDPAQPKYSEGIETDIYSRVTKVNGKGRWFHWAIKLPKTLDMLIDVYGKQLIFALAVRGLVTNFTNYVQSTDLSKPVSEVKAGFFGLEHLPYTKKAFDEKKANKNVKVKAEQSVAEYLATLTPEQALEWIRERVEK